MARRKNRKYNFPKNKILPTYANTNGSRVLNPDITRGIKYF